MAAKKADDTSARLRDYRKKRSADHTPEPFGVGSVSDGPEAAADWSRPRLFVVQKHAARRLHYDFRLEWEGVLLSWAIPHGPSPDTKERRLAVEVEPHPVEYADFEGVIPKDNYGAGSVIVWDQGRWVPLEDPGAGLEKGKLLFELRGFKLRGIWTLVRTKPKGKASAKEWLLIKKPDAWSGERGAAAFTPESIFSGLTLEELQSGEKRSEEIRAELVAARAHPKPVRVGDVKVMLAETAERAFSAPDWLFELKYDGFRLVAAREAPAVRRPGQGGRLFYRRGHEATDLFPEIATAIGALPYDVVLDGEVVVLDEAARPVFQRLQQRAQLRRHTDIARAAIEMPATLYVFDLLGFEGLDARELPLVERKAILRRILPKAGPLRFSDHVEEQGEALFAEVEQMRLEGVVAKRKDAPYRAGRSPHWLKVRADRTADFVVIGFTRPQGRRTGFGALHLAAHDGETLTYAGRVGSGFSEDQLVGMAGVLEQAQRADPPCAGPTPAAGAHVWVAPEWVAEVRYKEWTRERLLRQPVFLRFRDDKPPEECQLEALAPVSHRPPPERLGPASSTADEPPHVPFTNLDKVFWPEEGYTKGDLIHYYRSVSSWLMPYLGDRPVVLTRYPDGITGKSFFQKDAPGFAPGWVRTERMWSEHARREIDYFVCDRVEMLLYLINLGTIPLHIWSSRVATLQRPDWCILDLDPKGAPFKNVVALARALKRLCDEMGLAAFPKTSGASGLHVLVPLGRQLTYEQSRALGELMARVICTRLPDIATTQRSLGAREGRVYVDYLQNGHGRLLAGPLSVRPLPGAPVSTPLRWSEVSARLDPGRFTIRSVPARLKRLKEDPLAPVLDATPDLGSALSRLHESLL